MAERGCDLGHSYNPESCDMRVLEVRSGDKQMRKITRIVLLAMLLVAGLTVLGSGIREAHALPPNPCFEWDP